jgi:hypothetical protein
MSGGVGKHLDLFGLELTEGILDFFLGIFVSVTNVIIAVKNFVVEKLGELNRGFVQDCLVLVDTNHVRNARFQEYLAHLLRVAACYINELQRSGSSEILDFNRLSKGIT